MRVFRLLPWTTMLLFSVVDARNLASLRQPSLICSSRRGGWVSIPRGGSSDSMQSSSSAENETDSTKPADEAKDEATKLGSAKMEEWSRGQSNVGSEDDVFLAAQEYAEESTDATTAARHDSLAVDVDTATDRMGFSTDNEEFHDAREYLEPDVPGASSLENQGIYEEDNEEELTSIDDIDEKDASVREPHVAAYPDFAEMEAEDQDDSDITSKYQGEQQVGVEATFVTETPETSKEEWQDIVDAEPEEEVAAFVTTTTADVEEGESTVDIDMVHQHTTDDDSMTFVDRMELADDEGETVLNGLSGESDDRSAIGDSGADGQKLESSTIDNDSGQGDISPEQAEGMEDVHFDETAGTAVTDDEVQRILREELKFSRHEVKCLKPEIAAVLAQKGLRRPWEGVPPNWFKDGCSSKGARLSVPTKHLSKLALLPRYAVPIVLGALAIYGYNDLAEIFKAISSDDSAETEKAKEDDEVGESNMEPTEMASALPHPDSASGGVTPFDASTPTDQDDTWLDKAINRMLIPFKWFWSIEI